MIISGVLQCIRKPGLQVPATAANSFRAGPPQAVLAVVTDGQPDHVKHVCAAYANLGTAGIIHDVLDPLPDPKSNSMAAPDGRLRDDCLFADV